MSEHEQQSCFFDILRLNEAKYPFLKFVFAVPNGGHRHPATAAKLKREGVKRGTPDIFVPVYRHHAGGLFIEMKFGRGKCSPEQKQFLDYAISHYAVAVCYSADEAVKAVEEFLDIELSK